MQFASAAKSASPNWVTGSRYGSFTGAGIDDVCCGTALGMRTERLNPGPSPTALENSEPATKPSPHQMTADRRALPLERATQDCAGSPVDGVAAQSFCCLLLAMKTSLRTVPNRLQFPAACRSAQPHRNRRQRPDPMARRFSTVFHQLGASSEVSPEPWTARQLRQYA